MGQSSSSSKNSESTLFLQSNKKFNIRIKNYSYPHHGPYTEYIEWCRVQYEIDCIQENCIYGSGYTPQYDHYGEQIY